MNAPEKNYVIRFLDWLREGYPHGVPDADAGAITYVLRRQLNDADRRAIAKAYIEEHGMNEAAEASDEEIRALVEKLEMQTPEPADIDRIQKLLAKLGSPDAS